LCIKTQIKLLEEWLQLLPIQTILTIQIQTIQIYLYHNHKTLTKIKVAMLATCNNLSSHNNICNFTRNLNWCKDKCSCKHSYKIKMDNNLNRLVAVYNSCKEHLVIISSRLSSNSSNNWHKLHFKCNCNKLSKLSWFNKLSWLNKLLMDIILIQLEGLKMLITTIIRLI